MSGDMKIISSIFNEIKEKTNYLPIFDRIEKSIKTYSYKSHNSFAEDFRNTVNGYFEKYSFIPEMYSKIYQISKIFENLYKIYEDKEFVNKSKKYIEVKKKFYKLKRELKCVSNNNSLGFNNNKFKLCFQKDGDINLELNTGLNSKKHCRNYKLELANKIQLLTDQQKKGIVNILPKNMIRNPNVLEFDINKMGVFELRNLQNYIDQCLCQTSVNDSCISPFNHQSIQNTSSAPSPIPSNIDILNDNEISESLSSEEDSSVYS